MIGQIEMFASLKILLPQLVDTLDLTWIQNAQSQGKVNRIVAKISIFDLV